MKIFTAVLVLLFQLTNAQAANPTCQIALTSQGRLLESKVVELEFTQSPYSDLAVYKYRGQWASFNVEMHQIERSYVANIMTVDGSHFKATADQELTTEIFHHTEHLEIHCRL